MEANGKLISTRDAWTLAVLFFLLGSAFGWLLFAAPSGISALPSGSIADWIAAVAGCTAAIATIAIGRAAQKFTREAEEARRRESLDANLRDEAAAAAQRADIQESRKRDNEALVAKLLVMKSIAKKAFYPHDTLQHIFPPDGTVNSEFARSPHPLLLNLQLTLLYVDSIVLTDEFKTALDPASVDALAELEKALLWYRAITADKISELKSVKVDRDSDGTAPELDFLGDPIIAIMRRYAARLQERAQTFVYCLDARAKLFM